MQLNVEKFLGILQNHHLRERHKKYYYIFISDANDLIEQPSVTILHKK